MCVFQSKSNQSDKRIEDAVEKLQKSSTSKQIEDFHEAIDELLSSVDVVQKKNDRKKERFVHERHEHIIVILQNVTDCLLYLNREHLQNNRQLLLKSLSEVEDDAAQVLLIATQLLFQTITQTMIKVSGKFVSVILGFLQKHLNEQDFSVLQTYHGIRI